MPRNSKLLILILGMLFICKQGYAGEWLSQLYGANVWTKKHDSDVNLPDAGITGTHQGLRFDSATMLGIRQSYWFNPYIGLGLDGAYYFGPDQKQQVSLTRLCIEGEGCSLSPELIKKFHNRLFSLGFVLAFSYPLNFLQHPIEPYVGVGPMLFILQSQDTDNFIPAGQSSTSTSIGLKMLGGLNVFLTKKMGVFLEYQYNSFQANTTYYNHRVVHDIELGTTNGHEIFTLQSLVLGLSLRF